MEKAELFFDVFAIQPDSREHYAVEYTSWKELLSFDVLSRSIREYGIEVVCAAILYEMTFFGMEESAVDRERKKLVESVDEIKSGESAEIISFDDYKKELFGRLGDVDSYAFEKSCIEEEYTDVARRINEGILRELLSDYEKEHWMEVPDTRASTER